MKKLESKIVIVTGAAQGIGFGCAAALAREGAVVVLADIQDEAGEQAAARIRAEGGNARFQHCDVEIEEDCAALVQDAAARHGRLDGLVNNVGWFPRATIAETTTELWNKIMNLNLRGAMYCCKHAIPLLAAAGGGSVISINTPHGLQASHNLMAYGAAKAGLHNMMKTLAGAHAPDRIRFNSVSPGWVMTEGEIALQTRQGMTQADRDRIGASLPLGRFQLPEDTAKTVVFLVSDDSSQITGMFFSVDAGMTTLSQRRA